MRFENLVDQLYQTLQEPQEVISVQNSHFNTIQLWDLALGDQHLNSMLADWLMLDINPEHRIGMFIQ